MRAREVLEAGCHELKTHVASPGQSFGLVGHTPPPRGVCVMEAVAIQPSGVLHLKVHLFQRGRYALRSRVLMAESMSQCVREYSIRLLVHHCNVPRLVPVQAQTGCAV